MGFFFTLLLSLALLSGIAMFARRHFPSLPFLRFRNTVDYRYPRILMYHMISPHRPGAQFNKLRVPPEQFERQLAWLHDQGWTFFTLQELMTLAPNFPEKAVALTFDDGFADNYSRALPIMKKYGAKGTLYLVIDRHNNDWSTKKKAHHDSGELMHEPKLTDDQVHAMLASGLFELGGHTWSHANLATLDASQKSHEIETARQELESRFDTQVTSFAYPFGIYTDEDPQRVRQAGYSNAVTTVEGIETRFIENCFELKRIKIGGKDSLARVIHKLRFGTKR